MDMRLIVPVAVGAMILAAPAFAVEITNPVTPLAPPPPTLNKPKSPRTQNNMVPSAMCSALKRQLDMAIRRHPNADNVGEAKKMLEDGNAGCTGTDQRGGIEKLRKGLDALRVKPNI